MFVSSKIGSRNALYKNITDLKQERALLFLHDVQSVASCTQKIKCRRLIKIVGKYRYKLSLELFVKK